MLKAKPERHPTAGNRDVRLDKGWPALFAHAAKHIDALALFQPDMATDHGSFAFVGTHKADVLQQSDVDEIVPDGGQLARRKSNRQSTVGWLAARL